MIRVIDILQMVVWVLIIIGLVLIGLVPANKDNTIFNDGNQTTELTGMTDGGVKVKVEKTCVEGSYYLKGYGAVLGDYGAPEKCIYGSEEGGGEL